MVQHERRKIGVKNSQDCVKHHWREDKFTLRFWRIRLFHTPIPQLLLPCPQCASRACRPTWPDHHRAHLREKSPACPASGARVVAARARATPRRLPTDHQRHRDGAIRPEPPTRLSHRRALRRADRGDLRRRHLIGATTLADCRRGKACESMRKHAWPNPAPESAGRDRPRASRQLAGLTPVLTQLTRSRKFWAWTAGGRLQCP